MTTEAFMPAYDCALRSALAHGAGLLDFSYNLPRHDDIVILTDGTHALREETRDSGYTEHEERTFAQLVKEVPPTFFIPDTFAQDAETIIETHRQDIAELIRWIVRSPTPNTLHPTPANIRALAEASYAFHEALLSATDACMHIAHKDHAHHLMHRLIPELFSAHESLALALTHTLTLPLPLPIAAMATHGATDQIRTLLTSGEASGYEHEFFVTQGKMVRGMEG